MMKTKKLIGIIGGAVAIAAVAGVAINNANSAPKMSDLMIKNLEVLSQNEGAYDAQCEWAPSSTCTVTVQFSGTGDEDGVMTISTPDFRKK